MNSKVTLLFLIILLIVVGKSTFSLYGKNKEAQMKRESVSRESADIEMRKEFLEKEISRLQTKEGVETALRQKYNIKKEGEEVLVIIDGSKKEDPISQSSLRNRFQVFLTQIKDFFR